MPLRILVLDGQQAFAQALAARLADEDFVAGADAACLSSQAVSVLRTAHVDMLVVADELDDVDAPAFVSAAVRELPHLVVAALAECDDVERAIAMVSAGAVCLVPKSAPVEHLVTVLRGAARGESWLPPVMLGRILRRVLSDRSAADRQDARLDDLTYRERQVLRCIAEGMNRRQTAERLHVSVNTVRTHIQHLLAKLGAGSTLEAVSIVLRESAGNRS